MRELEKRWRRPRGYSNVASESISWQDIGQQGVELPVMAGRQRPPEGTATDAHQRAQTDFNEYGQSIRAAAQFAFGANGAALLAMASYVTDLKTGAPTTGVSPLSYYACAVFLLGLTFSFMCMVSFSVAKKKWGEYWEKVAIRREGNDRVCEKQHEEEMDKAFARADGFDTGTYWLLALGAFCLIPGSILMVAGLAIC